MTLREATSFEDDSRGPEDVNDVYLADYRCHGDCRFEISYTGEVVPKPQIDRGKCWYLNKDEEGVCFKQI